jgi:arylsulfatase A-like enzyme
MFFVPFSAIRWRILLSFLTLFFGSILLGAGLDRARPNVILIYADDLGYGDVGAYGATKVSTPNIDRLAAEGRLFTDAHTSSATCTPSRYSLLTGQYAWRTGNFSPVFAHSSLIIDTERMTLADLFKEAGYATAVIGKWHLGFGEGRGMPDWNGELKPGPLELGFDYYFGVPVVNSHPPFVYVENHHVFGLEADDPLTWRRNAPNPLTQKMPEKVTRPLPHGFGFAGGKKAHELYDDYQVGTKLTEKTLAWMQAQQGKPFFVYYATTAIHHPFTPHPRFEGTSEAGRYGDFIHELDWITGELMRQVEAMGQADNTVFIFTSDNGGMLNRGGQDAWAAGHRLNGDLQGFKFDVWEGGHRVPLIMKWPGVIPEGTRSDALVSSMDFMRMFAEYFRIELPETAAPDSLNILPELVSESPVGVRQQMVYAGQSRDHLSLREGDWVYIPTQGGGGFGNGLTGIKKSGNVNSDITPAGRIKPDAPEAQLYNLSKDFGQAVNVIEQFPEKARDMRERLIQATAPDWDPINGKEL